MIGQILSHTPAWVFALFVVLLVIGACGLIWGFTSVKALVDELAQAGKHLKALAEGQPSADPVVSGEVATLLGGVSGIVGQGIALSRAVEEMARQHEAGAIGYRMDARAFPGDFGQVVHGINPW